MDDRRRRLEMQVLPQLDAAYRFARWLAPSPPTQTLYRRRFLRGFRGFDALRGFDMKHGYSKS